MHSESTAPEKLVKDFMRPMDHYHFVREEATVREALRLMGLTKEEGKPSCLVVVGEGHNEKEVIKGFITASEVVFGLAAHFLKGAQRSGPIFWEGQFEEECLEGAAKRVGEIMIPIKGFVQEREMIMEAVFLLNKYQVNFLPVVNREQVMGMIHLEDILKEITRAVMR